MSGSIPLSVVIPSHYRADLLADCLHSVIRHAPVNTQIIVVDDGSRESCISETAHQFPQVQVIRLVRQRGFCIAANRGMEAARGEIVELLNDDTTVCSGWADAAIKRFQDESVAAVAPLVLDAASVNGAVPQIDSAGDGYDHGGFAFKRGHGQPLSDEFLRSCTVFGASGAGAFYRRSVLQAVGHFPVEFGAYFEDVDLAFRIGNAGFRTVFEPTSRIHHHGSASYGRRSRKLLEQQSLNEERVFWRNLARSRCWRTLARHVAVLCGKAVRRLQEGTLIPFLMGRIRLLRDVPSLILRSSK